MRGKGQCGRGEEEIKGAEERGGRVLGLGGAEEEEEEESTGRGEGIEWGKEGGR